MLTEKNIVMIKKLLTLNKSASKFRMSLPESLHIILTKQTLNESFWYSLFGVKYYFISSLQKIHYENTFVVGLQF